MTMSGGQVRDARRRAEQDEHVSVMPPWTIWVGAFVVVLVGAVSGWLLLSSFGGGSAQDKVRLEILKLTGSIVLGTGGGVALLLAARRQRAAEVDIAHKKKDAAERRVTELYTSAAEQLGSDKAAVRLAGLYALERLAQENAKHRPMIVDVICAYLRMPYTQPSDYDASSRSQDGRRRRGLHPPNRNAMSSSSILVAVRQIFSALSNVIGGQESQRQELQVRLAAQRLLATHLRPEKDKQGRPTNERFWPDMELDLTGAVLINWDMTECQSKYAEFADAEFRGKTSFSHVVFDEGASFDSAVFEGDLWFRSARFHGEARFTLATFNSDIWFSHATFYDAASLGGATFHESAWFEDVTFHGSVSIQNASFHGHVSFKSSIFNGGAFFENVTFGSKSSFQRVKFYQIVSFGSAAFERRVMLQDATFHGSVNFEVVTFHGDVWFGNTRARANDYKWPAGWVWREDPAHPVTAAERWGILMPSEEEGSEKCKLYSG